MWWIAIIVFLFLVPEILSTILESRIGRAVATQIEGRAKTGGDPTVVQTRIQDLEAEVERLSQDVHRLSQESEFFQRLLTERSGRADPGTGKGEPPR